MFTFSIFLDIDKLLMELVGDHIGRRGTYNRNTVYLLC